MTRCAKAPIPRFNRYYFGSRLEDGYYVLLVRDKPVLALSLQGDFYAENILINYPDFYMKLPEIPTNLRNTVCAP